MLLRIERFNATTHKTTFRTNPKNERKGKIQCVGLPTVLFGFIIGYESKVPDSPGVITTVRL